MKRRIKLLLALLSYFGPRWILFRAHYAFLKRLGWFRWRLPSSTWEARPLSHWVRANVPSDPANYAAWRKSHGGRFFFGDGIQPPVRRPEGIQLEHVIAEAEAILNGQWKYYSYAEHDIGFPPNWFHDPMTGYQQPSTGHWSQINEFSSTDVKNVWEASRFRSAFILGRAYLVSGDERYPEAFWQLIEDWSQHNPPNTGVNWLCGQETSLRIMAWCFGYYACLSSQHTTPERIAKLAAMIAAQGERIEINIEYAISQNNNHGISEAVGLLTIGLLFPEFKQAGHWRRRGEQVLNRLIPQQIFADGGFVQYSFNYQRLMLHVMMWAIRLSTLNKQPLSASIQNRIQRSAHFLFQMLDLNTGQVPNSGNNDGALVLPLTACDYTDYRPMLQTAFALLDGKRMFSSGPWNEEAWWLLGHDFYTLPEIKDLEPTSFHATTSGYYTLRMKESWVMLRACQYQARPHHADQLHIDLWWRGINIARDAGTYSYNTPDLWNEGLVGTAIHNTVTVDGRDQMTRASRFLWIDWSQSHVEKFTEASMEATHDSYMHVGVKHQRTVISITDECWLVLDRLESLYPHDYVLQWLLPDVPYEMRDSSILLNTNQGRYEIQYASQDPETQVDAVRADTKSVRGWESQYYSHRQPALSLRLSVSANNTAFVTLFSSVGYLMTVGDGLIGIFSEKGSWQFSYPVIDG